MYILLTQTRASTSVLCLQRKKICWKNGSFVLNIILLAQQCSNFFKATAKTGFGGLQSQVISSLYPATDSSKFGNNWEKIGK